MATAKRSRRTDPTAEQVRRANVQLTRDAYERLNLHAMMTRQSPGVLLSNLITSSLREFRVQRNTPTRGTVTESANCADQASESVAATAA